MQEAKARESLPTGAATTLLALVAVGQAASSVARRGYCGKPMRRAAGDDRVLANHLSIGINAEDDGGEGTRKVNVDWRWEFAVGCGGELQEAVAFRAGLAGHAIGSHELLAGVHVPNGGQGRSRGWVVGLKDSTLYQEAMLLITHIDPQSTNHVAPAGSGAIVHRHRYRHRIDGFAAVGGQAGGVETSPDGAKHRHAEVVVVEAAVDVAIGGYALCNCAGMIGEHHGREFSMAVKEALNAGGIGTWRSGGEIRR